MDDASSRHSMMEAWFQRLAGMICSVDVKLDRLSSKVDYLMDEVNDIKTTLVNSDTSNAENTIQASSTVDEGSQNVTDELIDMKKTIPLQLTVSASENSQIQDSNSVDISSQNVVVEQLSTNDDSSQIEVNITNTGDDVVPALFIRNGNNDDRNTNHESRPPVRADDAEYNCPEKTNPITLDIANLLNADTVLPRRHSSSTDSVESYESDSVYLSVPNGNDDTINQLGMYICPLLENAGNTNSEMLGGIDTSETDKYVDETTTLGISRTVEDVAVDLYNEKVSDNVGVEDGTVTMDERSHSRVDLVENRVDDTANDDMANITSLPTGLMDADCSQSIKDNNDNNMLSDINLHHNTDYEDIGQAIAANIDTSKQSRHIGDANDVFGEVSADSSLPLSCNMASSSAIGIEEIIPDQYDSDSDVHLTDHSTDCFKLQNVVSSTNGWTIHSSEAWKHEVGSKGLIADDVNMETRADTDNTSDERNNGSGGETDIGSEIPKTSDPVSPPHTQDQCICTDRPLAPPLSSSLCIEQQNFVYPVDCYKRRKTNPSDDNRMSYLSVDRTNDGGENDDNCEMGDHPGNGQTTPWSVDGDSVVLPNLEEIQPMVSEMESSYTDDSVGSMVTNAYQETMATDQQNTEEPIQPNDMSSLPFGTHVVVSSTWSGDESRKNIVGTVISDGKKGILKVLWDDGEEGLYGLEEFDAANIVQIDTPQTLVGNNYVWYGSRVIRGPHWKWAEQDGGEGNVGVVCKIETKPKGTIAHVIWPHCGVGNYRFGFRGKYDIIISPQWVYEESPDVWKPYCTDASRDMEAAFQDNPDSSLVVAVNSAQHAIDLTNLLARVVTNPTTVYYIRRIGNPDIA